MTKLTRQHFVTLAEALKSERPGTHWDPNKMVQWRLDVTAIARVCKRFNSGFKSARFFDAVGMELDEV